MGLQHVYKVLNLEARAGVKLSIAETVCRGWHDIQHPTLHGNAWKCWDDSIDEGMLCQSCSVFVSCVTCARGLARDVLRCSCVFRFRVLWLLLSLLLLLAVATVVCPAFVFRSKQMKN